MQNQKLHPHNIEAEKHVLGSLLVNEAAFDDVADILNATDFYNALHRKIFTAMTDLVNGQEGCNTVTVAETLRQRDPEASTKVAEYINMLASMVDTSANIVFFAKIIADTSKRRQVIALASKVANQGFDDEISGDDLVNNAQREFYEISDNSKVQSYVSAGEELKDFLARLQERYANKSPIIGIPSGLIDLDGMTAGFQNGDLIILAGRPSMGKTSLAMNIATHVACDTKSGAVGIFSLEMSRKQLIAKIVGSMSRIDFKRIRTGKVLDTDWPKIHRAANTLYTSPILIDDSSSPSVNQLRIKARKMAREHDLKLIIIDYLQLMRSDTKSEARHLEVSEISRALKGLARELNIPVIVLSQLNRQLESRADKRPIMSDLRESGAIEQDADLIMFVYRDTIYCEACKAGTCMIADHKNSAEIIIGKQRNGAVGTVKSLFLGEQGRFESVLR